MPSPFASTAGASLEARYCEAGSSSDIEEPVTDPLLQESFVADDDCTSPMDDIEFDATSVKFLRVLLQDSEQKESYTKRLKNTSNGKMSPSTLPRKTKSGKERGVPPASGWPVKSSSSVCSL